MMRTTRSILVIMVIALAAFSLGTVFQSRRIAQDARRHPCVIQVWNPDRASFVGMNADARDCLKLGPQRTISGTWADFAYMSRRFVPDDARNLPPDLDLDIDNLMRARLYWRAKLPGLPPQISARHYRLTIKGRLGHYDDPMIDGAQDIIVVDAVDAATLLPDPPRP